MPSSRETIWNPVQVEDAIRDCANRIAKNVDVVGAAYEAFLHADREYDLEFAKAYLNSAGRPANERRYYAERQTSSLRETRDIADAAYQLARNRSRAAELELSAFQSIGSSIRAQYGVAGRGEGA